MKNIFTIVKKELKRYFTDKRTLISLILPGLLIFVIYSIMGSITQSSNAEPKDVLYKVAIVNEPNDEKYTNMFKNGNIKVAIEKGTDEEIKTKLEEKIVDLYIVYDEAFLTKLENKESPNVSILFNSSNENSDFLYSYVSNYLGELAYTVTVNFTINGPDGNYDYAKSGDATKMFIQMLMPLLLIIFLFTGCMSICSEAIAGEKERGTIYTLLVTPTKRSEIALGKILALSIVALVSATASFIGTILGVPKLVSGAANGISLSVYGISTYIAIFLIILLTVIFFTSLLLLLSSFAKSVKEASQLALVIYIPTMLAGVLSMIDSGNASFTVGFIPIYNCIKTMSNIFSGEINYVLFTITIASNVIYTGILVFLLTKMFDSEKIMGAN